MLVQRGFGLGGLGAGDVPSAPPTSGYCFINGGWTWVNTAAECPQPLILGGAPQERVGFCWMPLNPPNPYPGYWMRKRSGQLVCETVGPPSPPNIPAGWCYDQNTGAWKWVLADQCGVPVQTGVDPRQQPGGGGGGVIVTSAGEGLTPTAMRTMSFPMVDRLFRTTWNAYFTREAAALKAWKETLPACTSDALKATGNCYPKSTAPQLMSGAIPGTFEVLGVPFNIAEPGVTKSPHFERIYTPNNEQRILAETTIIRRSRQLMDYALEQAIRTSNLAYELHVRLSEVPAKLSMQQVLNLLPRFKLAVPGMAIGSVVPTQEELTAEGGYAKWRKNGFLISLDLVEGKSRLYDERTSPVACIGGYCKCSDNPLPSCISSFVPTGENDPNLPGGNFWWYITVDPSGQLKLTGVHDDPSWIQRFGAVMAGIMTKLGNAVCTAGPAIQTQMASVVAEKCLDKNGKTCTKGSAGCTCISPGASTQGGVGLFNFIAGRMCARWIAEHAHNPAQPMPAVPDPQPLSLTPAWLKFMPWILGGLAVGAGSAYVLSRR